MPLFAAVLVPILQLPICATLIREIFYSQPSILWQIIAGFWISTFIRTTTRGLYVSFFHIAILSFFMSLVGDQILFLLPSASAQSLPWSDRIGEYETLALSQWITAMVLLFAGQFLPERGILATVWEFCGRIAGAVFQVRMFHRLPGSIQKGDERLWLSGGLVLMQWTQIVDWLARKVVKKRSVSKFCKPRLIIWISLSAAFVFALSRMSSISAIFGIYPFYMAVLLLLAVHCVMYVLA
jgi:hypothetical protein